MPKQHDLPFPRETFEAWLDAQPSDKIVGEARRAAACPCQMCIVELGIVPLAVEDRVLVYETHTFIQRARESDADYANPAWMKRLIESIDSWATVGDFEATTLSASRVRALLNSIQ